MHINLESTDSHSIQAYSDQAIRINSVDYQKSLIINSHEIISDWPINSIQQLDAQLIEPLLLSKAKVIIIGHQQLGKNVTPAIMQTLVEHRIGLEVMSIGAACRTFNVMLHEKREVVIGIIMEK